MSYCSKIVVTGACTAAGIVDSLKLLMPETQITPISVADVTTSPDGKAKLSAELSTADKWLFLDLPVFEEFIGSQIDQTNAIRFPALMFSAFHPDIVYADQVGGAPIFSATTNNNSAIVLWGFLNKLDTSDIVHLFNKRVFEDLGYLDYWQPSADSMRSDFEKCGLDFKHFFTRTKRYGCFMHTNNHAMSFVICELLRLILPRLGYKDDPYSVPFERYAIDYLQGLKWPIYPGIGERLGLMPMLTWVYESRFMNLAQYVESSLNVYRDNNIKDVACSRFDGTLYKSVLGAG